MKALCEQYAIVYGLSFAVEMATALYYPFKAVGYVTDGNPFFLNRLGDETFLTVSIGKSFQVHSTSWSREEYRLHRKTAIQLLVQSSSIRSTTPCLHLPH